MSHAQENLLSTHAAVSFFFALPVLGLPRDTDTQSDPVSWFAPPSASPSVLPLVGRSS